MRKLQKQFALLALVLAFALALAACEGSKSPAPVSDGTEKTFTLVVVDDTGAEASFSVTSAAASVGEALENIGMIEGRQEPAGFMVLTVNGVTADYNKDGHYWAFYIGDEYAMSGVKETEIEDGATYQLKVE